MQGGATSALIAGPIAQRLLGPAPGGLIAAAFVGAIIVLASDLIAVHALPVSLPTGVITGAVGAPYLIWLLATASRHFPAHPPYPGARYPRSARSIG